MIFNHIGPVCGHIRAGRVGRPDIAEMGRKIGYSGKDPGQQIRRFEEGRLVLSQKKFEKYVEALNLGPVQKENLLAMYHGYNNKTADEARLGHYSFDLIHKKEFKALNELSFIVETSSIPSIITDELLYIHAMNSAFLRLYGVKLGDLSNNVFWWHAVAIKYISDEKSPVRKAHKGFEGAFFHRELGRFFNRTSQYFFTTQFQYLVQNTCRLSPSWFAREWEDLLLMRDIPEELSNIRSFRYQNRIIDLEVIDRAKSATIEVVPQQFLNFDIIEFRVRGSDSNAIYDDIAKHKVGKAIHFADDYLGAYPNGPDSEAAGA